MAPKFSKRSVLKLPINLCYLISQNCHKVQKLEEIIHNWNYYNNWNSNNWTLDIHTFF